MAQSSNKYILFYSDRCRHSKEFLIQLNKCQDLVKKFRFINIDDTKIRLPPAIKEVPTIIVPGINREDMYVGQEGLKWLEMAGNLSRQQQQKQQPKIEGQIQQTPGGIADYDPSAMSGFSDSFTLIDTGGNELIDQSGGSLLGKNFQSLRDMGAPMTPMPPSDNYSESDKLKGEASKKALMELQAQRDKDIPQPISRT